MSSMKDDVVVIRMSLTQHEAQVMVDACGLIDVVKLEDGVAYIRNEKGSYAAADFAAHIKLVEEARAGRALAASGLGTLSA